MHIERKKNLPCGSSFVHRTSTISLIPYFNKKKLSCTKCFRLFISAAIPKKGLGKVYILQC